MDAQQDVPQFKLAKVGRGRKKAAAAGLFGLFGGAGESGVGGIAGFLDSGVGGIAGFLGSAGGKIAVLLLMATLGVGAYNIGRIFAQQQGKAKPRPFAAELAQKQKENASQQPVQSDRASQSGLAMIAGSLDGLTPEERAALAKAKADEEARAAAEAKAKEDAKAKKDSQMTPDALLAAATGSGKDKDKEMGRRVGELSRSVGGLAGGRGLSGGMGRGFDSPAFQGGAGKLLAMANTRAPAGGAPTRSVSPRSGGGHLARAQAMKAAQYSRQASMTSGETSATKAYSAFNGEPAASGAAGEGLAMGTPQTGTPFTPNPANSNNTGGGDGGSGDSGSDDCNALFPDGTYMNSAAGGCIKVPGGDVDPTTIYFQYLQILCIIATLLCLAITIISILATYYKFLEALVKILAWALGIVGGLQAIIGLMLVGMGRTIEGSIFTVIGLLNALCAYYAYTNMGAIVNTKNALGMVGIYGWIVSLAEACSAGFASNPSKGHYDANSKTWKYS